MADIITYPENGITYDADDASGYLATRLSGVYSAEEDFSVTAQGGLSVQVSAGQAWVRPARFKGRSIIMAQPETLVLTAADAVRSRIDRVVLRYDAAAKKTRLVVLDGTPDSAAPAAPDISRTELAYDLCLAEIRRPAGSTAVTAADITDTRADETVCGVMRDGVTGIPAATLIQRLRAEIDKLDKGSFYDKTEVDTLLNSLQEQMSKMGASGQPVVVWSFGAKVDRGATKTTTVADNVDYLIFSTTYAGSSSLVVLRGKSVTWGSMKVTFAQNGTLTIRNSSDGGYGDPIYFTGYHYLTPSDGAKSPYIVDVLQNSSSNKTLTVDSSVDYIEADGQYIARGTPTGSDPSFSSEGAITLHYTSANSNGYKYYPTTIILYHLITPEELNNKNVAAQAAQADADALNLDQDYRLTLLELGVTDDETTETA